MTKRTVFALTVLALAARAQAAFECAPPRCQDVPVPVPPALSVPNSAVRILLPSGYDANPNRRYPVLYLLHGAGDTYKRWSENTDVFDLTSGLDLIVVMPDCRGGPGDLPGWYTDWHDGSRQWETFHTDVLIDWIDSNLRTLGAGHRAVAGLSMGGYGAMKYAARHPGLFQAAASFSGAVDIMHGFPVNGVVFRLIQPFLGTPDDRVWGNQITDQENWRAHNPTDLADRLDGVKLLIATGNGLPGGAHDEPTRVGGTVDPVENGVWQMNVSFIRALDVAGVKHTDLLHGPGQHSWPYWRDALAWALPQILAVVR